MNLSVIVSSKRSNDIDYLISKLNLESILKSKGEIIFVLYEKTYTNQEFKNENIVVLLDQRNGIYSSYNAGIQASSRDLYLILGDDDKLCLEGLEINQLIRQFNFDILIFDVYKNNKVVSGFFPERIKTTVLGVFPSHTGGLIIRKELHNEYGFYDLNFKILADQLFFIQSILSKKNLIYIPKLLSLVGNEGLSSDYQGSLKELRKIIYTLNLNKYSIFATYFMGLKRRVKELWLKLKY